uniref:Nucleoside-triphosphatase ENT89_02030 n=1 Tax=Geoglobus ahangari TaxID=113653 RepID=A0A7C3YG35_9EURY
MKVAITGRPGIGKTTACLKIYEALKDRLTIKGFVTKEIRRNRERIGFEIIELDSGRRFKLAEKGEGYPRVGKYKVFIKNIDEIAKKIPEYQADLLIIDEVGPMELKSPLFVKNIENLIHSDRDIILTIHYKLRHPLLEKIRSLFEVILLNQSNRDRIVEDVVSRLDTRGYG